MANDTPFDPDMIPKLVVGEPLPTMPFAPARDPKEPFAVRDEATANWVVRKIVEARAYRDRVEAYAESEMRRADRHEEFFLKQYGPALEEWAKKRMAEDGNRQKRVRLPAGSVGYRASRDQLKASDETLLMQWCRDHLPGAIVRTERVKWTPLNEHFRNTGECPDGTDPVPGSDRFYVK